MGEVQERWDRACPGDAEPCGVGKQEKRLLLAACPHHRLGWLCANSSLEDSVNASFISLYRLYGLKSRGQACPGVPLRQRQPRVPQGTQPWPDSQPHSWEMLVLRTGLSNMLIPAENSRCGGLS